MDKHPKKNPCSKEFTNFYLHFRKEAMSWHRQHTEMQTSNQTKKLLNDLMCAKQNNTWFGGKG